MLKYVKKKLLELYSPNKEFVETIRESKFRPQIALFFTYNRKIMMVHYHKHKIWGIIQGGIEINESVEDAIYREIKEEMGEMFYYYVKSLKKNFEFINDDKILVNKDDYIDHPDKTKRDIVGKYFLCYTMELDEHCPKKVHSHEFDKIKWLSYLNITSKYTNVFGGGGKTAMIMKVINILRNKNLL